MSKKHVYVGGKKRASAYLQTQQAMEAGTSWRPVARASPLTAFPKSGFLIPTASAENLLTSVPLLYSIPD